MNTRHLPPLLLAAALITAGCTPTVAVQAPSEPITVNLNVKIEHEIRVKVDRELENVFEDKEGIF
ncbi:YnbE family lipoprotein [Microbulbifer yueqingensis]|uniref:YnbE-like lipoprotein n=1 Tax=Microbulbifer yueqingensis TaxID=658219 RepID=A0A1G9E578_9GAMM|nr:YnbE family lipoprotein [Microbulbifer yueqingensis]SDK71321.1 YnbE-like lipoprotein [Microbulbifer yueqingensis]